MTLEPVSEGKARLAQTSPLPFLFLNHESEGIAMLEILISTAIRLERLYVRRSEKISHMSEKLVSRYRPKKVN